MQYVSQPLIYPSSVEYREYQRKIVEVSSRKNTLVILPTALGKTIISALIAANVLYSFMDKKILVMAPTRPLAMQHKNVFQRIIMLPQEDFVLLTGKINSEYREAIWNGPSRIIFATPQVVRNDMLLKGLKLNDFGLVVFDECHRSVKEYAYTEVAKQYVSHSEYPVILGMTASPGSDIERVKMVCQSLFIEQVEYRSDEDPDVKPYIHPVQVEWCKVDLPLQYQPLRDILKGMLKSKINWLQSRGFLKNIFNVTRTQLLELGAELRYNAEMSIEEERGPIYKVIMYQSSALTIFHMLELLESQGTYTLEKFLEKMESDDKKSHISLGREEPYIQMKVFLSGPCFSEHPKVDLLKKLVRDQLKVNPDSRILVFTQYRDTSTHLVEVMNKLEGVRADRFVGQANKIGDKGLTQEQQASLISELRNGNLNILVATSIAEEGLDIPEVDLVIFYEPIPSEIRYIQRRGRTGRRTAGKVMILATNNTSDMIYLYTSSRRVEKMKTIISKINSLLQPILRMRSEPVAKPMSQQELLEITSKSSSGKETLLSKNVVDDLKSLRKDIAKAEEKLYIKILQSGSNGLSDYELHDMMELEGFPRNISKAALSKLVKKNYISNKDGRSITLIKNIPGAKMMDIMIEKVLPGKAIVSVDGRWKAILLPENYVGLNKLIKKNSCFKALCELYHDSEKIYVKVRQVIQILK